MNPGAAGGMLLAAALGYVSGSLPFGLWLGRAFRGVDVRTLGSKNLGATNVYRTLGPALGIATLLLDLLKGALPVWIVPALPMLAGFPGGLRVCAMVVGLFAIVGHVWTFLAGFRGGKGVATAAGVALALAPFAFLAALGVFVLMVGITRYISVGSILGAGAFAIVATALAPRGLLDPIAGFGVLVALLVLVRHRENVGRLLRGEEQRFTFRRGGAP